MRLLVFNLKGSDKYTEVRKCTQNPGRLTTRFLNVGNFNGIVLISSWVGWEEESLTMEETQGNLHFREQSSDSLQWLIGFNSVRSQALGEEMHNLGRSCVVRAELPQPACALCPSRDVSTSLPDFRGTTCLRKSPPQQHGLCGTR